MRTAFALALLAAAAAGQDDDETWREDPYTEGDPAAMAEAGYLSFGPLAWGDRHNTNDIEDVVGDVKMLWVETAHFRIGSSLDECRIESDEKKEIGAELKRLSKRLPRVKPSARKLDRWLRLHLYAQRAEELYADVRELLGREDDDFPTEPGTTTQHGYLGEGPYLGQRGKFLLLLFEKQSGVARYANRFAGRPGDEPLRYTFENGSLIFAVSREDDTEGDDETRTDTELHCQVAFNLATNLLNGYTNYTFVIPLWLTEGLSHWYRRRVHEEHPSYTYVAEEGRNITGEWDWEPKVRGRVRNEAYRPAREICTKLDWEGFRFADHMMVWSRVDYLMSLGPQKLGRIVTAVKSRADGSIVPTPEEMLAAQERALEEEFGFAYETLDEQWRKWVLAKYER